MTPEDLKERLELTAMSLQGLIDDAVLAQRQHDAKVARAMCNCHEHSIECIHQRIAAAILGENA